MQTELMLIVAVPVFIACMLAEGWWTARTKREGKHKGYELRDTAASLSMGIGYLIIASIFKLVLVPAYYWAYEFRLFEIEPSVGAWIGVVVAQDFAFYWYHRYHHEVRMFWAAHVNHHSSQHYNLSTALRQSWTAPVTSCVFFLPLALVGFHPAMIITAELANLFYQFWIHTEVIDNLGPLEKVLNTASHHRVHHGSNEKYLDTNYGAIFIIWDRMFGTFQAEEEQVCYGLSKNIDTFNPVRIAFHEWAAMAKDVAGSRSLGDGLGYVLREPGWLPEQDGVEAVDVQQLDSRLSARAL